MTHVLVLDVHMHSKREQREHFSWANKDVEFFRKGGCDDGDIVSCKRGGGGVYVSRTIQAITGKDRKSHRQV